MNKAIPAICLSFFLCACASQNKTASIHGLTPTQADSMSSQNAKITEAKAPDVTANTRFAAGELAESQGNLDAAIHQYNVALDKDPKHLPSLFRLGVIYAELKQYNKSFAIWARYGVASNNSPEYYGNLGYCYEVTDQPTKAEATYLKGIERYPNNAPCRTNYGLMLARKHRIQEAIRMWTPVLTDAEIHYNLGSIYEIDGRKEEAKVEYQKALDSDPDMIDARARLSETQ